MRAWLRLFGIFPLVLAAAVTLSSAGPALAARVALVIGNDAYENVPALQKAVADAEAYADLLEEMGFDQVMLKTDLDRNGMDDAIGAFLDLIQPGDTALFAYSGHGWSDGRENYILGVDAPITGTVERLARISIPLRNGATGILDDMDRRGATAKIAIIDACRDNPFTATNGGRGVGVGRGLTRVDPPRGTFLVFSAGPGQTALDRLSDTDADKNSVFTRVFVPAVESGITLQDAIKETQRRVSDLARSVNHDQQPAYTDEMLTLTCLGGECTPEQLAAAGRAPAPNVAPTPPAEVAAAIDREALFWNSILNSTNAADYQAYLDQFPSGLFAPLARNRIAALTPVAAAPRPVALPPGAPVAPRLDGPQVIVEGPPAAPALADALSVPPVVIALAPTTQPLPGEGGDIADGCDRLAAAPDPAAGIAGVSEEALRLEAAAAVAACRTATERDPGNARAQFQLGRALAAAGDGTAALAAYQTAAGLGHAAAMAEIGRLYEQGPALAPGIAADPGKAAAAYLDALAHGHAPTFARFGNDPNSFPDAVRREVQRFLIAKGYLRGSADGVIGPRSHAALEAYRQALITGVYPTLPAQVATPAARTTPSRTPPRAQPPRAQPGLFNVFGNQQPRQRRVEEEESSSEPVEHHGS